MGLVNSAWDPLNGAYCLLKAETCASKKRKKEEEENTNAAGETPIQTHTKFIIKEEEKIIIIHTITKPLNH